MNYLGIDKASINNGPGVRVVLWVSGCTLHCKGCQNPESWDFCAGKFSGGNPIERKNIGCVLSLITEIKERFPNKDIWLYTGLTVDIEDFAQSSCDMIINNEILRRCDVVVDGPYIEEQRDITLKFRGSRNQRLIDVKETLKQGKIITIQN